MPVSDGRVSCPWCRWRLDTDATPMGRRSAERRLEHHKRRCPRRRSESVERSDVDVHGESVFERNANQ
jgi:uncharacterized Zn finger protein (UPF0148 family)